MDGRTGAKVIRGIGEKSVYVSFHTEEKRDAFTELIMDSICGYTIEIETKGNNIKISNK